MMKIPRVQNAFPTVSIPSEYNKFPKDTVPKIKPQIGIGNECKNAGSMFSSTHPFLTYENFN